MQSTTQKVRYSTIYYRVKRILYTIWTNYVKTDEENTIDGVESGGTLFDSNELSRYRHSFENGYYPSRDGRGGSSS